MPPSSSKHDHNCDNADGVRECLIEVLILPKMTKTREETHVVTIEVDEVGIEYYARLEDERTSIFLGHQKIETMKSGIGVDEGLIIFACKQVSIEKPSKLKIESYDTELYDWICDCLPRNCDFKKLHLKGTCYEDLLDIADYFRAKEYILEGYTSKQTQSPVRPYEGKMLLQSSNMKAAEKVLIRNFHVNGTGWAGVDYRNLTVDMHPRDAIFLNGSLPRPSFVATCIQKWVGRCGRTKELHVLTFDENCEICGFIEQDADITMQVMEDGAAYYNGEAKVGGKGGVVRLLIVRHPDDSRFAVVNMKEVRPHGIAR